MSRKIFASMPHQKLERWYHSAKPSVRSYFGGAPPSYHTEMQLKSEIDAYKDEPLHDRLLRIHDLLEKYRFQSDSEYHVNPPFMEMANVIREHLAQEGYFQDIVNRWKHIPPERLFMWQHDADHLAQQSRMRSGEFGGGARIVDEGRKGFRIQPTYSTTDRMHLSVPFYVEPFLSTRSDLFWHIHPQGIGHTLSVHDIEHSRLTGVPTMVTGITPEGLAATEINIGDARHPVRIVRRPFHALYSLFEKISKRR